MHGTGGAERVFGRRSARRRSRSIVVWSKTAGFICDATKRIQISRYSLSWSSARNGAISSGVRMAEVGRTASCASCASFFDL